MKQNTSEKNIKDILDDLYKIDPFFEQYEEKVKEAIKDLLKSKPDVQIDDKFVMELRERIMDKVEELKLKPQKKSGVFWQTIFGQKFAYGLSGVLTLILLAGLAFYFINSKTNNVLRTGGNIVQNSFKKIALADNAFGSLNSDVTTPSAENLQSGSVPLGLGGGNNDNITSNIGTKSVSSVGGGTGGGGGFAVGGPTSMIAPICAAPDCYSYYSPNYIYVGDNINLDQNQVEVLRKRNKIEYGGSVSGLLQSFGFGVADIGGFDGARIQSVNLVQDKDFGYSIYINFDEGTISIDSYWPKWPRQQLTDCKGEVCVATNLEDWKNLSEADIPTDEKLISITDGFAAGHGIDLSFYGQPEVMKEWITSVPVPMSTGQKIMQPYVSDYVSIKYPLKIDNKIVYDQSGSKFGLTIVVNIRYNKVSGVYNLYLQDYESSMYEAETDFSNILKIAEKGGVYNYFAQGSPTKDVEIGTPIEAYVATWKYDANSQTSNMLLIPALVFPITKNTDGYYSNITNIVVPLAEELLSDYNNYPDPVPMPLIQEKVL